MSRKLPSFQFYPGDWWKDPDLRRCSPAARGIWIDIMCLMFENSPRGELSSKGKAWTTADIADCITGGGDRLTVENAIQELVLKNVMRKNPKGIFFSKRLRRDEKARRGRQKGAKTTNEKRWGNANDSERLQIQRLAEDVAPGSLSRAPTRARVSSSSSSSSSSVVPKREREGSTAGQNGTGKISLSLPSDFFEKYFDPEKEHAGRWALREFGWCYFKPEEFHQAKAQWQKKGIPDEDWKINLRVLDGKLQRKAKTEEVREGMATHYLCTFMLTDALEAKRKHQLTKKG